MDEAGAGSLAGGWYMPLSSCHWGWSCPSSTTPKQVSPRRRDLLFDHVKEQATAWSAAWASHEEIDVLDIPNARILAMQRAIDGPHL